MTKKSSNRIPDEYWDEHRDAYNSHAFFQTICCNIFRDQAIRRLELIMNEENRSAITLLMFVIGVILGSIYLEIVNTNDPIGLIKAVFITVLSMIALPYCAYMLSSSFIPENEK